MRILIADDHPLYLEAVRLRLQALYAEAQFAEAVSVDDVLKHGGDGAAPFDLVLLDLRMPGMASMDDFGRIRAAFPGTPIAIMSGSANQEDVREMIQAGARGFLPKTMSAGAFAAGVSLLLAGGTYLPTDVLQDLAAHGPAPRDMFDTLTPRERQVLAQIVAGASNKEIGRSFGLSEVTVKLHVRQILKKIDARNRAEAAAMAAKAGLI